jgi:predicted metal-dependent phosphoesterase TrpH
VKGGIDLHIHTSASDGLHSPADVVRMASEAGLCVIAISDHDTVDGIAPALDAVSGRALEVIPAVSTESDGSREVHMLGYFIDWTAEELAGDLVRLRNSRLGRARAMRDRLSELGMPISWERVQELAGEGSIGRPHLARVLQEAGFVGSTREAFDLYLARGRPAYVSRFKIAVGEAIRLINNAGGVAVLAHPWGLDDLVPDLAPQGLAGLEIHYPGYTPDMIEHLSTLAAAHDLVCTGGSDFHGLAILPDNMLGAIRVPIECLEGLRARKQTRAHPGLDDVPAI